MSRLPAFFALRALEAAARHRSYSRAADELSVTHGAVSQQIRKLEGELGAMLFHRRGNAMIPTPAAEKLARQVSRSLDILSNGVAEFTAAADRDPLVVSLDPQFAQRWLPPRMPRLFAETPGGLLELRVEERRADFTTDGVDMGVRWGAGEWPGLERRQILWESLFPVCSPAFAEKHMMTSPGCLVDVPRLRWTIRPWSVWFERVGVDPPEETGLIFDDSVMLLNAAAEGLGAALARSGLVESDLKSGRLVRPLPEAVKGNFGFFCVWRADSRKLARIQALADWLELVAKEAEVEA